MATALPVNVTVEQGSDFIYEHTVKDVNGSAVDLTNYSVVGTFARNFTTDTKYNFTATIPTPLEGSVTLELDSVTTAGLKAGRYVYSVFLTNSVSGAVDRELEGIVTVTPAVI